MDDAATYARDEDFDILSQDGSTMTPASTATIESGSSGTLVPIDHRPWAKGAAQASRESVASRSSFMSFFRKRKNTGPSDKQVQTAFKNSDVATIHLWLEAGGSANAPLKLDSKRALPLEWASKAWSVNGGERNSQVIKVIEMLIEYGADVNRGYDCFWPFWFAVMMDGNGSGELIQCFIDHGADVHRDYDPGLFDYANGFLPNDWETGSLPITMLEGACRQGLATAVLLLIRAGANINAMAASESNKPMHRLACCANPANHDFHVWDTLIKEFIRAGADVNAQNRLAKTPLCFAVSPRRGRNLDMVKALVMNGASWQHRDFEGKSMFHYLTDEDNTYEWLVPRGKGFTFCSWLTCSQSIPLARPLRRPHNSRPQ
jgi:ankyrin repeat protein